MKTMESPTVKRTLSRDPKTKALVYSLYSQETEQTECKKKKKRKPSSRRVSNFIRIDNQQFVHPVESE